MLWDYKIMARNTRRPLNHQDHRLVWHFTNHWQTPRICHFPGGPTCQYEDDCEGEKVRVGAEEADVHATAPGERLRHFVVEDGVHVGAVAPRHAGCACRRRDRPGGVGASGERAQSTNAHWQHLISYMIWNSMGVNRVRYVCTYIDKLKLGLYTSKYWIHIYFKFEKTGKLAKTLRLCLVFCPVLYNTNWANCRNTILCFYVAYLVISNL